METWVSQFGNIFIGYRFWWGGKNKHNFYVVNVTVKKEQVKQIHMFCFEEAFLHSHGSKILSRILSDNPYPL